MIGQTTADLLIIVGTVGLSVISAFVYSIRKAARV